jgi:hypothetical protein
MNKSEILYSFMPPTFDGMVLFGILDVEMAFVTKFLEREPTAFIDWFNWASSPQGYDYWASVNSVIVGCGNVDLDELKELNMRGEL